MLSSAVKQQNPAQVCSWGIGCFFKGLMLCSITTVSHASSEKRLKEGNPEQAFAGRGCLEALLYPFFITVLFNTVSGSSSEEHLLASTSHGHQNCREALKPWAAAEQRHCTELGGFQCLILLR